MLSLNVGDRASITWSGKKGDTPLHIKWLKNGILIDPSQRISVTQVDQFNSILVIEHLQASHSGNYSCVVSNQAAEVESSQALLVNGKKNLNEIKFCYRVSACFARGAIDKKKIEKKNFYNVSSGLFGFIFELNVTLQNEKIKKSKHIQSTIQFYLFLLSICLYLYLSISCIF
jgi:hypothetical protein